MGVTVNSIDACRTCGFHALLNGECVRANIGIKLLLTLK